MHWLLALTVGVLVTCSVYLMLRRSLVKVLLGIGLLGHAANLTVFTLGTVTRGRAPIVPPGAVVPEPGYADPIPQALVLTAIVIGLAVIAFLAVLIYRTVQTHGTGDTDVLTATET